MKKAIIIGAGPAGLNAAYELLTRSDIKPIIIEKSGDIGGISKTVKYKGNGMDIGGHRFFSKSDRVMNWWLNIMPIDQFSDEPIQITYQNKSTFVGGKAGENDKKPANPNLIMLVRNRLSRIYYRRSFFSYPISLDFSTLSNLGFARVCNIMISYFYSRLFYRKKEKTLEDFFIRRFGKTLYETFFKDYTEKVCGKPCNQISAEWGHQRIKKLSISSALKHAAANMLPKKNQTDISQKNTETSLIERFLYPKMGPGQLWEEVARQVVEMGGEIHMNSLVSAININDHKVTSIKTIDRSTGNTTELEGDYFFSTMPVKELIASIDGTVPDDVAKVAAGLEYRDFVTVGLLLNKLKVTNKDNTQIKDNWIYIQEPDVKIGRLQVFNNWSPFLVNDPEKIWIGLEYFCNEGDELWSMKDQDFISFAIDELHKIKIIDKSEVLDSTLIRMEKTYPAYFGTYDDFHKVRDYTNNFSNLFLVGRNGMHKYNNADHSMLTAMTAVDNILNNITDKNNIWEINTEQDYHESK